MSAEQKVAVVTGASQGIGAGILQAFRDRNYRVVATSRSIKPVADSDVVTVQGDVGAPSQMPPGYSNYAASPSSAPFLGMQVPHFSAPGLL
jgi:NAD(P)-dependent dehydrogenase (short-subunit alcohol dehydrogenase family)